MMIMKTSFWKRQKLLATYESDREEIGTLTADADLEEGISILDR